MRYKDFIAEIAKDSKFTQNDVRIILNKMSNVLVAEMKDLDSDGSIIVSNMGTFKRVLVKERAYSVNGHEGVTPAHYKLVFNPAVAVADDIASVVVE